MVKKIFGSAFVALSLFALSVPAMADRPARQGACTEQSCDSLQPARPARGYLKAFEGINLTADQKARLEALRPQKAQFPDSATYSKGKGRKMKVQRPQQQPTDSAAMQAPRDRCQAHQARAEAMKNGRLEYLAKVKEILTPEQYTQFLENMFVYSPAPSHDKGMRKAGSQAKKGKGTKAGKGKKGHKAHASSRKHKTDTQSRRDARSAQSQS